MISCLLKRQRLTLMNKNDPKEIEKFLIESIKIMILIEIEVDHN